MSENYPLYLQSEMGNICPLFPFGEENDKKIKKVLAICRPVVYTMCCCGMIAMKREVAAYG